MSLLERGFSFRRKKKLFLDLTLKDSDLTDLGLGVVFL